MVRESEPEDALPRARNRAQERASSGSRFAGREATATRGVVAGVEDFGRLKRIFEQWKFTDALRNRCDVASVEVEAATDLLNK